MGGVEPRCEHVDLGFKAVFCDGRGRDPPLDLQPILGIIVESVSWVTEVVLWEHHGDQCLLERKRHFGSTEL